MIAFGLDSERDEVKIDSCGHPDARQILPVVPNQSGLSITRRITCFNYVNVHNQVTFTSTIFIVEHRLFFEDRYPKLLNVS